MTILAWINNQTNICENISSDDRSASEISIPGYQLIDLEQTLAVDWSWDGTEWVMKDADIGEGGIGDTYENGKLIKSKPTESPSQPVTSGTQEI